LQHWQAECVLYSTNVNLLITLNEIKMKTTKHIVSKPRVHKGQSTQTENRTELQQDLSEMQSKGKQILKSVGNIARNLDWKDYVKLGVAGAVGVYAFRKRNAIVSLAAPVVMGMLTEGIAKAKDLRQEFAHA
jgi:hypothetical protein